ncbi:histidine kinase dimerization/phosphoacceptor domain -containing protein [Sphingomonas sp.]|uniref:histidine kinase dimerization/phosphoacceptor domain -containing protein n=1 Tax=Sphingomonas sp. TaxID=28214 RepID=UPI002D7F6B17|nr:histidine kinase dimerization/phosphoacceptor domain -containing protein [Sphingomonas sp.]HEU0043943.1 histidine kinase dimerization/phosphoacceptor domain -containing protein [Sphingomonas sp.]
MAVSTPRPDIGFDLDACDREPIHIPGSIQPHGLLLVSDADTLRVVAGAGALERELAADWLGRDLSALLGQDVPALIGNMPPGPGGTLVGEPVKGASGSYDVALHRAEGMLIAELEPVSEAPWTGGALLAWLDGIASNFERAGDLLALCARAATAFRALTGYDRVMVYRFVDDEAGRVVAEDRDPALGTFMHHHFPATDIPKQARALYIRNRSRVIPAISYTPAPLRPAGFEQLDLSDAALRSVSPIHLQYLRNMGVEASASISIVKDGTLWGLIACHHHAPKRIPRDIRAAASALAGGLARQIRAKEEAETYRERLRLRAAEDAVIPRTARGQPLHEAVRAVSRDLQTMFGADGFAMVENNQVSLYGVCPPEAFVAAVAAWSRASKRGEPFATSHLPTVYPAAAGHAAMASGLLSIPLADDNATLLWFRAEQVEEVEWAGNPHKAVGLDPNAVLTPRTSFESWTQTVRGRARRWTLEEMDAARRIRRVFHEAHLSRQLVALNKALQTTLADRDALLVQKDILMKEVDHRVQNSLQLVGAFLSIQAREAGPGPVSDQLAEAQSRIAAVALVQKRLYQGDQIATIDLSRYLEELIGDLRTTLGPHWARQMHLDLAPVLVPTDRAVRIGLISTELVINATKYAYGGDAGPLDISLEQHRDRFRFVVADRGRGKSGDGQGFGSRMLVAMVASLAGSIEYGDNDPGLRVALAAPIEDPPR